MSVALKFAACERSVKIMLHCTKIIDIILPTRILEPNPSHKRGAINQITFKKEIE